MGKTKVREIEIRESHGGFLFRGEMNVKKSSYDFDGIDSFKKMISKEKARMIDCIKYKKPSSIYSLAKILGRPFKAVFDDAKLLERFGIINFIEEKKNGRTCHKPVVAVDHLIVHIRI